MLKATVELFMSEYFLFRAVLGKYLDCGEDLFRRLGKIFLISEKEADALYSLSENETAKAICTESDFMQYQRMRKYTELVGLASEQNAQWEEAAVIKGNAILTAQSHNLLLGADASRNAVYNCLTAAATGGTVSALRILGVLQCEGIFLGKNEAAGIKNLVKAADWNDSAGTLALLYYGKQSRAFNMARLRQEVKDTPFDELYPLAAEKYGEGCAYDTEEIRLLNKAFSSGVLKRETYDPKYARILNSKALDIKDKEKAVFTLNKEQLSVISDLPLKLTRAISGYSDAGVSIRTVLNREAEDLAISRALKNSDLRELPSYRPICLCCDSKYVLNTYAKAITARNENLHTERIDVAELIEYDFEPSPNNIFVRSIDEDKDNRFLLFFCGEIPERKTDAVKSFLQSGRRAKFHLNSPNVTLNLSSVLPVCFCDTQNAPLLKSCCDIVNLSEVKTEELSAVIADILAGKQMVYGTGKITLGGGAETLFKGTDVDSAEKLIDTAVRARREAGADIVLTREILEEYAQDSDKTVIGFGGDTDARRK
ncbi:MAG: hypothetical protein K2N22_00510 [Clostridia bacterium]|nr:hypothetical protein [Clostridia bacterium]